MAWGLPRVTESIRGQRLRLAGHIERHNELIALDLLFWNQMADARKSRAWTPEDILYRRAEEGYRTRGLCRDAEAGAGPGALEEVHRVSDVEVSKSGDMIRHDFIN